jgi:transcriptional regulator with XRE-family HTH domain
MPSVVPQGERISDFRRVHGLTQLELALRSGVSERTIRNAERGRPVKRDFLLFIAAGLGVSLDEVIQASSHVSSQLRWQRNLEKLMSAMQRLFSENSCLHVLEFAHEDVSCRVQGTIPGYARSGRIFGAFDGAARFQEFLGSVRHLWQEVGAGDYVLEKPIGDSETVVLRCSHAVRLANGQITLLRSVLVGEFEVQRLRRVDIYVAPGEERDADEIRAPARLAILDSRPRRA